MIINTSKVVGERDFISYFLKDVYEWSAGFENELLIWGIIAADAEVIPKSFEDKEQFCCTKMRNRG